jgi:Second Messenger Oligonucleotide or Dinucleotide Synthetase domain
MYLTTHFEELLKRLRPSPDRIEMAKTLPPLVQNFLKSHPDFPTLRPHVHLVGSYGQKMSAGDIKDVDFVVRVPGNHDKNEPPAKELISQLYATLDELPAALEMEGYADIDLERARRSVHVCFTEQEFHMDVVPCIAPDGFDEPVWVPDRGFERWIESHPVGVVNLIAELEKEHPGKVRNLGILLKHFRNQQMKQRKPKSYWLTALLLQHVQERLDMTQPIGVLFRDLVAAIHRQYASTYDRPGAVPHVKDPMLGHDVSWNWQRTHFETFMRRLEDGKKWATSALEADSKEDAVASWQKAFGAEYFPAEVGEAAKRWATTATPGKSAVTTTGSIVGLGTVGATSTRPTTYHGDA